jgi:hypothetical protein
MRFELGRRNRGMEERRVKILAIAIQSLIVRDMAFPNRAMGL